MRFFLTAMLVILVGTASGEAPRAAVSPPRAVLVTGASSGIGRKVTERLAAGGYFVYATARKPEDLKALGAMKNVQALRLDVTQPADIAAAVETIGKAGRGLYGLVNNAGVATVGSVANMSFDEFDLVMKVNAYGPVEMIRAFEPLLIERQGRIVNIGSISGILASQNLTAYAMSKHAVEALTDSLAAQLEPQGVRVSVIEPGNYNSNIARNALERIGADSGATHSPGYKLQADRSQYKEPDEVAAAVEQALSDPHPKRRYMVVPNQTEAEITIRKQIEQLVQLNEGQPYSYDRAALIRMLDEGLAGARPGTN
ncbi:MAG TPA: SDR family NAD(P)-dependent oxidoreductase [Steroidobacteraceae bacterium]|nr:SDR family NAD(P)-dependent oxidoreductase [Steroidobacteraceae bacterium]